MSCGSFAKVIVAFTLDHVPPRLPEEGETSPGSVWGPFVITWVGTVCAWAAGIAEAVIRHAAAKAELIVLKIMIVVSSR